MPIQTYSAALRLALVATLTGSICAGDATLPAVFEKTAVPAAEAKPLEIINLFELLNKAERIVVGEIAATKDGVTTVLVRQTLKAPENDPKYIPPEKFRAAEQLLQNDTAAVAAVVDKTKQAPQQLQVVAEKATRLPAEGAQAIFFLWDKARIVGGTVYRLAHPQNLYDIELLPQVKAAASRPRSVADGRFLRDWDRQMAEKGRQREADKALGKAKGGEVVTGLRLKAARPQLSLRGSNSFSVSANIENTRPRRIEVYDGPASGYAVRLTPKDGAGEPIVLWHSMKDLPAGVDNAILSIADITDFSTVMGNGLMTKELFFDARHYPALTKISGEYMLSVIYHSTQTGEGLGLDSPVWIGTLISEEVPFRFDTIHKAEKATP